MKISIFGKGEIADIAMHYFESDYGYHVDNFVVDDEFATESSFAGHSLISWSDFLASKTEETKLHIALSYRNMNSIRSEVFNRAIKANINLVSYISNHAYISRKSVIGKNVFILENQVVQHGVRIEDNVMLWSGNHIGHSSIIGESTYISSQVVISGHTIIGKRCFFGVNSSTRDFVRIEDECFVGMNAAVVGNLAKGSAVLPPRSEVIGANDPRCIKVKAKATGK